MASPETSPSPNKVQLPRPKSPPELYGKRRELAKVVMLEREIGFLQEELKSIETLRPASSCIKEVADYVVANPEPLITTCKKTRKSCGFWKWLLCGSSCFDNMSSWISCCCCCCGGCLEMPRCCDTCSLPDCSCSCSLPKYHCCSFKPRCPRCLKQCWCCQCPKCDYNCSCWPKCPSCPDCSCSCCDCCSCIGLFSCWPKCSCPKRPKCRRCSCSGCFSLDDCCYSCCQCC